MRNAKPGPHAADDGSALLLALVVITVVGLILGAVISFAGTGLKVSPQVRQARNQTNYVGGALQGAAALIRNSTTLGNTFATCPDYTPAAPSSTNSDGASGHSYKVTCTPRDASGGAAVDQPRFAIQTLGTGAGDGINHNSGNNELTIDGGVYSKGIISNNQKSMTILGSAYAEGSCTGTIVATDAIGKQCNYTDTQSLGSDPAYSAAVPDIASLQSLIGPTTSLDTGADPIPTCTGNPNVVIFAPGFYNLRPSDLAAIGNCTGNTYWFTPGQYVLAFAGNWDLGSPHAVSVVGGTPASGQTWPTDGSDPPLGSACDPAQPGVQWEIASAARLTVTSGGGIELCGPTAAQGFPGQPQKIALDGFAPNANNTATTSVGLTSQLFAAAGAPSGGALWTTNATPSTSGAQTINDGKIATIDLSNGTAQTLSYAGFAAIPKGSTVQGFKLRLTQTLVNSTLSVKVTTPLGGTTAVNTSSIGVNSVCSVALPCDVPVTLGSLIAPAWRDLDKIGVTYTVQRNSVGVASAAVDGVALVVDYTPPSLLASSCIGACALLQSTVNLNVFFHGTVYAPTGRLSVEVQNKNGTIFDRGVIARTLDINANASSTQTASPFQLPKGTPFGRIVLFTGYVDNQVRVRACVMYKDASGTSAFPGYRMAVTHYSVVRTPDAIDPACT